MIRQIYERDESGLWRFTIIQDDVVRSHTPFQFPTLKAAKKLMNECIKPIRRGNGVKEKIIKQVIK